MEQIESDYSKLTGSDLNQVKLLLADEATSMLHGSSCLAAIHSTVNSLYSSSSNSSSSSDSLAALAPIKLSLQASQSSELTIIDLLTIAKITASKNEGRRCIESGSIRVDGIKIEDPKIKLQELCEKHGNSNGNKELKISHGKKKHFLVQLDFQ